MGTSIILTCLVCRSELCLSVTPMTPSTDPTLARSLLTGSTTLQMNARQHIVTVMPARHTAPHSLHVTSLHRWARRNGMRTTVGGGCYIIPDSSIISGGWYRARGCPGELTCGRALNQDSYQRPDAGRSVSHKGRWYE